MIQGLRARESADGLIELPRPPGLRRGDQIRIVSGPFENQLAIFEGMRPRERVEVLLALLGAERRIEVSRRDITVLRPIVEP